MLAIDADSHFIEPLDLFERRQAQRFVIDYQLPPAGGRVFFHLVGTIAKAGVDTLDSPLQLEKRGTLFSHAVCERRGRLHHEQLRRRWH